MNQANSFNNGFAFVKISELLIGNLICLLAGFLGYLTGFLKAILGGPKRQFPDGNEDGTYHSNGE